MIISNIKMLQKKLADIRISDSSQFEEEITVLLDLAEILNKTDPDEACNLAEQALLIAQEHEVDITIARCYKIQGISYSYRGEYDKALDYSLKALAIYEDTNDKIELSITLNAIGNIYGKSKDQDNALKYYLRSLALSEKVGDIKGIAKTNNNLGNIYQDQKNFEKALGFTERSLQSFTELGDDLGIATSCNNIGIILENQGNLAAAKKQFKKAYEIFKRIEYTSGFAASCNNLGELLTIQGKFKQARRYLDQALKAAKEVDAKYREICAYENLSNLYKEMGDFSGALEYYRKYNDLSHKVFSDESSRNMIQLQIRFETERKKKEAAIYKLKNIELQNEISERIHFEEELRKHQDQLEELINERTIKLKNSYNKLERGFQGTIELFSKITELKDPYTSGHQVRVAKLASAIAREMELPEEKIEAIHVASLVHDIGKINVPQEILSKPGILSNLEMKMIQIHPQAGYNILSEINFPWPIAEIVREHHEHIDGSGYPQGLKGNDISIEARIICVADVIEAMSFHRPYRAVLGLKEAVQEITDNEDILYDKDVVRACKKVICEKGFSFN
ncbi:MAG: tetratricopeptide repeat protein [Candidatus Aegiribacteria sp.]|nr:tetratricopeptide repeat protein [Candidatus Aegiribacteria sp.]